MRRLMVITDRRMMGDRPLARAKALLEQLGPRVILQIREKDLSSREIYGWIEALLPAAQERRAALMVNDRADIARCFAPLVGLHLPERGLDPASARALLGPEPLLGASIHDPERVSDLSSCGVDFVALAPIFEVPGKGPPLGLDALRRAVELAGDRLAVFGLGGIDASRAPGVWAAGAKGVAVIRAAWDAPDPGVLLCD